jgi:hypothetical protein
VDQDWTRAVPKSVPQGPDTLAQPPIDGDFSYRVPAAGAGCAGRGELAAGRRGAGRAVDPPDQFNAGRDRRQEYPGVAVPGGRVDPDLHRFMSIAWFRSILVAGRGPGAGPAWVRA